MLLTLLSPQTSTLTGTLSRTLDGATLVSSGELVTPSTSSAILIPSSNNPSYRSGFYSPRRGGTPKYPSLWDGCVGAWAPSLGATGLTLRDESVYGNHGTLTNMDAASDWVVSGGKGALDFDGSNDRVPLSKNVDACPNVTLSNWVRATSASQFQQMIGHDNTATDPSRIWQWRIDQTSGTVRAIFFTSGNTNGQAVSTTNVVGLGWVHVAATWDGTTIKVYVNGKEEGITSFSGAVTNVATVFPTLGGSVGAYSGSPSVAGQLDDFRIYNRTLAGTEIRTLALRRGIAFERASRKLSLFSAPAPTGSVSSTLANATLSSSGTLASGLSGSLSAVLADATLSATGTLTNAATGSLSSTLADASLSSSGTVAAGASGTLTSTLDAATLASSGTVGSGLTATVSVTLDNATLSSTGGAAGSVSGSVSSTLAAVTCSSSATLTAGLSGTVTRTLADVVSSATGTLAAGASGSVTRTLADATLVSTGSFGAGLTAQVNRALDSCVVSSTGTVSNGATGSLSVQLASATLQSGNVALGGFRLKVAGEWKNANAFVKVTGTWKSATPFVKVGGIWE